MYLGVLAALGAGLMWGLVFIAPLLFPQTSPWLLTLGRYSAFAVLCVPVALCQGKALSDLSRHDWRKALSLTLVGNFAYYFFISSSIQSLGAVIPTLIIGTLPIVIALCAQWFGFNHSSSVSIRMLLPAFLLVALGLLLVNAEALRGLSIGALQPTQYGFGLLYAALAVLAWTWYPLKNSEWLTLNPSVSASTWSTAQGLVTLPVCALIFIGLWLFDATVDLNAPLLPFVGLMLALGFFASWLGTLCWNAASKRTPASLTGQLIVFETLSALLYAFFVEQRFPSLSELAGIACLVAGVIVGVRKFTAKQTL